MLNITHSAGVAIYENLQTAILSFMTIDAMLTVIMRYSTCGFDFSLFKMFLHYLQQ
jgi:hypothetical protein